MVLERLPKEYVAFTWNNKNQYVVYLHTIRFDSFKKEILASENYFF